MENKEKKKFGIKKMHIELGKGKKSQTQSDNLLPE